MRPLPVRDRDVSNRLSCRVRAEQRCTGKGEPHVLVLEGGAELVVGLHLLDLGRAELGEEPEIEPLINSGNHHGACVVLARLAALADHHRRIESGQQIGHALLGLVIGSRGCCAVRHACFLLFLLLFERPPHRQLIYMGLSRRFETQERLTFAPSIRCHKPTEPHRLPFVLPFASLLASDR